LFCEHKFLLTKSHNLVYYNSEEIKMTTKSKKYFNIHEAKTHFSKLIQKTLRGDEVVIAKGNKPIVKLVPIEERTPLRKLGTAKRFITIPLDFDAPIEDFKDYQ